MGATSTLALSHVASSVSIYLANASVGRAWEISFARQGGDRSILHGPCPPAINLQRIISDEVPSSVRSGLKERAKAALEALSAL